MPHEFTHTRRVEFAETDMAGIAHFSRFLVWMEETEHAFLRSLGLAVIFNDHEGRHVGLPRVAVACDYTAPARYQDTITIRLGVERRGTKSLTYRFAFTRDGVLLASGRSSCVCCRMIDETDGSGRRRLESIPLPESFAVITQAPHTP